MLRAQVATVGSPSRDAAGQKLPQVRGGEAETGAAIRGVMGQGTSSNVASINWDHGHVIRDDVSLPPKSKALRVNYLRI